MIVGNGSGMDATVTVFNAETSTAWQSGTVTFNPFTGWTLGIRVGAADVNGDGEKDVLVGLAGGDAPAWRAHDGMTGTIISANLAFASAFTGGIYVAGGVGRGDAKAAVTEYVYDALGRLTQTIEGFVGALDWQQKLTSFAYDALGNRTSLTDAAGNVTTWVYDGLSGLVEEIDPRSESIFYTYDTAGDLAKRTDRNGRVTEYDVDNLGRLIEERWLDATQGVIETITFGYDALGRMLTAATDVAGTTDGDSSLTYTYDAAGRLRSASNNGVTVPLTVLTSTYDALGNRETLSANAGGLLDFLNTYTYDDLGRMRSVTQQDQTGGRLMADKRVDLDYDALGRFTDITRRAGLLETSALVAATEYAYDPKGRLSRLSHADGEGDALAEYLYGYDFADRLIWSQTPTDTARFHYDSSGQLIFEDHSNQDDKTYPYDATGNRVAPDRPAEDGNRVVEDGTHTYQYDDEGNLTRETEKATGEYQEYLWDHRNQLVRVELRTQAGVLTTAVEYDYDAFHRLIHRRVDTNGDGTFDEAQKFVYDGTQIVLVFDDTGAVTNRMLWGPAVDQLFADENAVNEVLWALTDNLGSVRDVVEFDSGTSTTSVVNRLDYDAFGNVVSETNPNETPLFKFTGRYTDPVTGDQWNLNRWYKPRNGRWLSEDPIGFDGGDVNLYGYVFSSPTNDIDPSGLQVG